MQLVYPLQQGRGVFRTTREVQPDEELCISYTDTSMATPERKQCVIALCSAAVSTGECCTGTSSGPMGLTASVRGASEDYATFAFLLELGRTCFNSLPVRHLPCAADSERIGDAFVAAATLSENCTGGTTGWQLASGIVRKFCLRAPGGVNSSCCRRVRTEFLVRAIVAREPLLRLYSMLHCQYKML